ncbi:hypothetical protein JCM17960_18610 [Magnetospira thiophila]
MPFVRRTAEGQIEALYDRPYEGAEEELHGDSPEVVDFLVGREQAQWVSSDLALARVLEDLIDVLLERHVITFSDLPPAAQQKLITRRGLRKELDYVASLFPESSDEDF